jgi:hypothetical protein
MAPALFLSSGRLEWWQLHRRVLREEGKGVEKEMTKRKKEKGEPAASLLRRHHTTLIAAAAGRRAAAERRATQKREMGREKMV